MTRVVNFIKVKCIYIAALCFEHFLKAAQAGITSKSLHAETRAAIRSFASVIHLTERTQFGPF